MDAESVVIFNSKMYTRLQSGPAACLLNQDGSLNVQAYQGQLPPGPTDTATSMVVCLMSGNALGHIQGPKIADVDRLES